MKKYEIIKKNSDFKRLYRRNRCIVTPLFFVVYYNNNRYGCVRMGITAGKKIGNAVQRNRAKRIIRHAFAEMAPKIKKGYDFVIVARSKSVYSKSTQALVMLEKHLALNNLLDSQL